MTEYSALPTDEPEQEVVVETVIEPAVTETAESSVDASPELPAYDSDAAPTKLPTYDEYESNLNDTRSTEVIEFLVSNDGVIPGVGMPLGDDFTFCGTFFISFFLNWFGFLIAYFFSRTLAGKCGATSGFGLGLIKLSFVVRSQTLQTHEQQPYMIWLVWALILFGWFTFVRGITMYFKFKRDLNIAQVIANSPTTA
eukprot:Awhi_evm1s9730